MQKITPFLWFDRQAEEAVQFYTSLFPGSGTDHIARYGKEGQEVHGMPEGTVLTMDFHLGGQRFTAMNAGPIFRFNPSVSFFVVCETESETDRLWNSLAEGGMVLMPYEKYPWAEKYGWVQDRYGLSWQVSQGKLDDVHGNPISPSLLFVNDRQGQAADAVEYYTSVFKGEGTSITGILRYGPGEEGPEGTVQHAQFRLFGQTFMVMDSPLKQEFGFNEALSFVIHCETSDEVDYYWQQLSAVPEAEQCGWLKDKFGVSWQVVPAALGKMLSDPDKAKAGRVMNAMLQMKKLDVGELERAYNP